MKRMNEQSNSSYQGIPNTEYRRKHLIGVREVWIETDGHQTVMGVMVKWYTDCGLIGLMARAILLQYL